MVICMFLEAQLQNALKSPSINGLLLAGTLTHGFIYF